MIKYKHLFCSTVLAALLFSCNQNKPQKNAEVLATPTAHDTALVKNETTPPPGVKAVVKQSDWYAENLKKAVKMIIDSVFWSADANVLPGQDGSKTRCFQNTYDTSGFLILSITTYMEKARPVKEQQHYTYKFDAKGNNTERFGDDNKEVYEYDAKGNMIEKESYYT